MRPRHILLLGIMLILVAGLAVLLFGHRLGGACPPGSGILVVTYNIGDINGNRVEAEELAEILTVMGDPEIVFLQEVPYAGFAESVASLLPRDARRYTAYSRLIGAAVISAFPLSRAETVTYPSPSSWYGGLLVTAEIGSADVLLCNVHLRPIRKTRDSTGYVAMRLGESFRILGQELFGETQRTAAMRAVLGAVEGSPNTILAGDLNTIPFSKTVRIASRGYRDVLFPEVDYFRGTYGKIRTILPPRVDYIFVSRTFGVAASRVVTSEAGDHFPIAAEICLKLAD